MNWPPIDIPVLGRSGIIALVALFHFPFFVNFVMGAPVIAVISEWLGKRTGNPFYNRISKHLANMAFVTVGVGAFGGIALVATNIGLFPKFFSMGAGVFFWPLIIEIGAFMLEAIGIALYKYTWDKYHHTPTHYIIGLIGAFGAWFSGFIINGLASFMLTPGQWVQTKDVFDAWFNPSFLPSYLHRCVAAFSITGFFMIIYTLWMFGRAKSEEDHSYVKWSLRYSGKWALISTALQFFPGVWYLTALERGTSLAAPEGSVVPKLLNGQLTFFWFGGIILAATAILLVYFLSVQNPKTGLKLVGRLGLILSVLLILTTNAFMGFTRERARKPYLVYGAVYGNQIMTDMMTKMFADDEASQPEVEEVGNPKEGKVLFESGPCLACHNLEGVGGVVKALDGVGTRLSAEQISALLSSPPAGMPPYGGTKAEKSDLVAFLESLK
ncbi:MAG: cytochrome ubiquinol oxidase subunit I [Anaerolineaceae bacterium]